VPFDVDDFGSVVFAKPREGVSEYFIAATAKPIDNSPALLANRNNHRPAVVLYGPAFYQSFSPQPIGQLGYSRSRYPEGGSQPACWKRFHSKEPERLRLDKRQIHFADLCVMVIQHQPKQPLYEPVQNRIHFSYFKFFIDINH